MENQMPNINDLITEKLAKKASATSEADDRDNNRVMVYPTASEKDRFAKVCKKMGESQKDFGTKIFLIALAECEKAIEQMEKAAKEAKPEVPK